MGRDRVHCVRRLSSRSSRHQTDLSTSVSKKSQVKRLSSWQTVCMRIKNDSKSGCLVEHERENAAAPFRSINTHMLYIKTTTSWLLYSPALNENSHIEVGHRHPAHQCWSTQVITALSFTWIWRMWCISFLCHVCYDVRFYSQCHIRTKTELVSIVMSCTVPHKLFQKPLW